MSCGLEPLHAIFSLACGAMGVFTAVVEGAALPVFDPRQDLPLRRPVALQLIGNDDAGHVLEPFEQLAKELLGRLLITPALDQDVEHVVVLANSTPQVMAFAIDREKHLIEMPFVPWLGASTLQLIGVVLPKLQTPLANGFMSDVDTAFTEELLHVTVAQGEAIIQPDAMADDLTREAVGYCWRTP